MVLREELRAIGGKGGMSRMQSSSLEYLNTTDEEVQRCELRSKLSKRHNK